MTKKITLLIGIVLLLIFFFFSSHITHAQSNAPTTTPAPISITPEPYSDTSSAEIDIGELIAQFGPLVIAAIFATLLGFFGFQRLQNLDTEIRTTREDRDRLRNELRSDLQNNLTRSLKIQEERLEILESKITTELSLQQQQFNGIIEEQQQTITRQLNDIKHTSLDFADRAKKLIEEIDNRRQRFLDETAWLRESSIALRKPRNVKDSYDLATAAQSGGKRLEGLQVLQLIVDTDESLHGTGNDYFNAAVRAASFGDLVLARQINAKGLEHYPEDIDLLTDYADNCGKTGEIQEATRIWDELSDNPKANKYWRYWILVLLENPGKPADMGVEKR